MGKTQSDIALTLGNQKQYYTMYNVGKVKYTVSDYDGVKTHKDGSKFWGIACFSNKKKRDAYIKELQKQGYIERPFSLTK